MANPFEEVLNLGKPASLGGLTESAQTTPQIDDLVARPTDNVKIDDLVARPTDENQSFNLDAPPAFEADVPPVIDATGVADGISDPTEISPLLQQFMDERDRLAETGSALPLPPEEAPAPEPREAVESTGTATQINELFPEQEGLGDKYLALRKQSGADKIEATLQTAQDALDELNAQIEGIGDDVRGQIGQDAPASFIAATIADRTRRLAPELRRRQRAVNSATRRLTAIDAKVSQQLGFTEKDMNAEIARRTAERNNVFQIIQTLGPEAFANASPEQIADLEKKVGMPPGSLAAGLESLQNEAEASDNQFVTVDGRIQLQSKKTGEMIADIGPADADFAPRISNIGGRQVLVEMNPDGSVKQTDLGASPSGGGGGSSSSLTKTALGNAQTMLDNIALMANAGSSVPGWANGLVVKDGKTWKAIDVSVQNYATVVNAQANSDLAKATSPEAVAAGITRGLDAGYGYNAIRESMYADGVPPEVYSKALKSLLD